MLQNTLIKPAPSKPLLTLNLPNIDQRFPGFAIGDFALLHGSHAVTSLASLLCVRAQLPAQLGGLRSNVVFIDGGNTFRLYQIAQLARIHQLDPKQTLERIYISRAFTAYQMTTLILEKLKEAVSLYDAKLVIISDIATFFLDKCVPEEEAREVFSQVTAYLSNFSRKNETVLIATYPPHQETRRNSYLHAIASARANVVISLSQSGYKRELVLEKHPRYVLGSVELPSDACRLTDFMEA
ncbi:MAG: hypothetical protein QXL10_06065 [Candidatus Bathyarchaeia archaeon]